MAEEDEGLQGGQEGNEGGDGSQEGGGEDRSWIPEDLRGEKSLDAIKDVPGLAKSYVEAQKLIGARDEGSVKIPGEDATPEDWAEFYGKTGRPESAEGYGLVKPDDIPDGVQWDEGMVDWFGKVAHGAGLSKAQAHGLMNSWNDMQYAMGHEAQKTMKLDIDNLKETWGDQFKGNVELGMRGIERLLPANEVKELNAALESSGMGNRAIMLKWAYQVGKLLKADGYIMGDSQSGFVGADAAKAKIAEITADKTHPHNIMDDPGHDAAVKEMTLLFKTAYPE